MSGQEATTAGASEPKEQKGPPANNPKYRNRKSAKARKAKKRNAEIAARNTKIAAEATALKPDDSKAEDTQPALNSEIKEAEKADEKTEGTEASGKIEGSDASKDTAKVDENTTADNASLDSAKADKNPLADEEPKAQARSLSPSTLMFCQFGQTTSDVNCGDAQEAIRYEEQDNAGIQDNINEFRQEASAGVACETNEQKDLPVTNKKHRNRKAARARKARKRRAAIEARNAAITIEGTALKTKDSKPEDAQTAVNAGTNEAEKADEKPEETDASVKEIVSDASKDTARPEQNLLADEEPAPQARCSSPRSFGSGQFDGTTGDEYDGNDYDPDINKLELTPGYLR